MAGLLKRATLWTLGKLLAVSVFAATSLASCGALFYGSSAVQYPEQTRFPNGALPADFMVALEKRVASSPQERFTAVRLARFDGGLAKAPDPFRLSIKQYSSRQGDPWSFRVIEETAAYQIIELTHDNSHSIRTKYRVAADGITPISYRSDGGVGLAMLLTPLFLGCLWLGVVAARTATRWLAAVMSRAAT